MDFVHLLTLIILYRTWLFEPYAFLETMLKANEQVPCCLFDAFSYDTNSPNCFACAFIEHCLLLQSV